MIEPTYWAEVEDAWEGRSTRPEPVKPRLGGALLAAAMFGLAEALEPREQGEVVLEVDTDQPSQPVDGLTLHFDPGSPRRTVAVLHDAGSRPGPRRPDAVVRRP